MASLPHDVVARTDSRAGLDPGYVVAGDGVPVVLLHASLGSKSQWTPLVLRLSARYRVVALDLWGYGANALPPRSWSTFTLDDEVSLVARRLDRIVGAGTRVHLVGHSYGGLVALRLAVCRSDRVASLTLFEPVAFRALDADDETRLHVRRLAEHVSALLAGGQRHEAAKVFVDFWGGGGTFGSLPLPAQAAIAARVDKVPYDFRAAMSWPLDVRDLRALVVPTLLLIGNHSPAVAQRIHARLTRVIPGRRVGAFECGHMGPVTHAHRLNPWIEGFLDFCVEQQGRRP
jgi:pimeloyl-ACP methyl ester carboxylesterase